MPRKPRMQSTSGYYHWISRGLNKKKVFHRKSDFETFLELIKEHKDVCGVEIYHYCLMTNHIHLLIKTENVPSLSKFSHFLLRRYAYYYCKTHRWRGQVFTRMYRSVPIHNEEYLLECGRYIERNPVRANLTERLDDWPYCSYRYYAQGAANKLITPSPSFLAMGNTKNKRQKNYRDYVGQERFYEALIDKELKISNLSPSDDVRKG
jgi:putative transposase